MNLKVLLVWALLGACTYQTRFQYISDSNITTILPAKPAPNFKIACFILSLDHPHLLTLISQRQLNYKPPQACGKLYVGVLEHNSRLLEQLRIKRYPYAGVAIFLQKNWQWYGLPDIYTPQVLSIFASKMKAYVGDWDYFPKNIDADAQKSPISARFNPSLLAKISLTKNTFITNFMLNPLYYSLLLIPDTNAAHLLQISNKHYQTESVQQLRILLNSFVLSTVNEFTPASFAVVTDYPYQYQQADGETRPYLLYLVLLDSIDNRNQSIRYKQIVNQVLQEGAIKRLKQKIYVFWGEASLNSKKKQLLGFVKNDQPPLIGLLDPFNTEKNMHKHPMLSSKSFNKANLLSYFIQYQQDLFTQQQARLTEQLFTEQGIHKVKNTIGNSSLVLSVSYFNQQMVSNFKFVLQRLNRFTFDQNVKLFYGPQLPFGAYLSLKGLEMIHIADENQINLEAEQLCNLIDSKIQQVQKLQGWLPEHWCIPEYRMRQYLLSIYNEQVL